MAHESVSRQNDLVKVEHLTVPHSLGRSPTLVDCTKKLVTGKHSYFSCSSQWQRKEIIEISLVNVVKKICCWQKGQTSHNYCSRRIF
jgi:hypothetical protein